MSAPTTEPRLVAWSDWSRESSRTAWHGRARPARSSRFERVGDDPDAEVGIGFALATLEFIASAGRDPA